MVLRPWHRRREPTLESALVIASSLTSVLCFRSLRIYLFFCTKSLFALAYSNPEIILNPEVLPGHPSLWEQPAPLVSVINIWKVFTPNSCQSSHTQQCFSCICPWNFTDSCICPHMWGFRVYLEIYCSMLLWSAFSRIHPANIKLHRSLPCPYFAGFESFHAVKEFI